MGFLYRFKRRFEKEREACLIKLAKPNKDALWIFGMQKAGTSAIAGLLAHRAGKTVTIDTPYLWNPYLNQIKSGQISLEEHIRKYPFDFSKEIIKEPNASYILEEIESYFELNQYVFIIRNPYDNIRSILNRLNIPGNQQNIDMSEINPNWHGLFESKGRNYVNDLAQIWAETYSNNAFIDSDRCLLIKYEEFRKNKNGVIDGICKDLNFEKKNSIEELKNHNFQPKGDADVNLKQFFGENYETIHRICNKQMEKFGYK